MQKKVLLHILFLFLTFEISVFSATYTVTSNANSGVGTLRDAITLAQNGDLINFNIGTSTITLTSNLPQIASGVTIDGGGTPNSATVFGSPLNTVHNVTITSSSAAVTILLNIGNSSNVIIKGLILLNSSSSLISISGNNNQILGCYIGTNGTAASGTSARYGIYISDGANNLIGNGTPAGANVISGVGINTSPSPGSGIYITGTSATGNTIKGNIIGLRSNGTTIITGANYQRYGIYLAQGAASNIIGGGIAGEGNVLSGNSNRGVNLYAAGSNNSIKGNYIGLQSDGITRVANNPQGYGITIDANSAGTFTSSNTIIGGTSYSDRNVISGHNFFGIYLTSTTGTSIKCNMIGLTKNGGLVANNTQTRGIQFQDGANNNTIGGNTPVERNYISDNSEMGICFVSFNGVVTNCTGNVIKGNYIGTDTAGTTKIGNQGTGINIGDTGVGNTFGGTGSGEGNLISGNGTGVLNYGSLNLFYGNIIGPQINGTSATIGGTQGTGISIMSGTNTIGGTTAAHRNIISGNSSYGIYISSQGGYPTPTGNIIKGNYIGPGSTLLAISGATQNYGIYLMGGTNNNIIGGTLTGEANIIAYNAINGCVVTGSGTIRNKISGSPHYTMGSKLINLTYGINGGNNNQPVPVITSATASLISGTAQPGDVVEVFRDLNNACIDAHVYLGSATANGSGNWNLAVTLSSGNTVLATARDANNNTSEFSNCGTVCPPVTFAQSATICSNQSFTLPDGSTTNVSGVYYDTLVSAGGCDSVITSTLTVKPISTLSQNISICNGDSLLVGSTYYYNAGNFIDTLVSANGCDSIITTNLTIKPVYTFTQNLSLCQGQSVTVGSNTYTASGSYTDVLTAQNGCDSTVTTNLTIKPVFTFSQNIVLCTGQSVTVGSNTYSSPGTYTDVLTASNGCDSTVTTNVTVLPDITYSQNITLCQGQSVTVGSNTYTTSGIYSDVLTASNGCDSSVTTNLTVNPVYSNSQNVSLCNGDSITIGSNTYYNAGTFIDSLTTAKGCDSVISTSITILPIYTISQNFTICQGQTVTVGGSTYNASGTYNDVLPSKDGCDSSITTTIVVLPVFTTNQSFTLCQGQTITVGSNTYSTSGSYTDVLTAINGCDSTVTTTLVVNPTYNNSQSFTLCLGDSVIIGTNVYNSNGTYIDSLTSGAGCDSVVTTSIIVIPPDSTLSSVILCPGTTYTLPDGTIANSPGTYINTTLSLVTGCDSTVTTIITAGVPATATVTPTYDTIFVGGDSVVLQASGGVSYSWTPSNGLSSTTDSIVSAAPNVSTMYCVYVTNKDGCVDSACALVVWYDPCPVRYNLEEIPNVFTPNGDYVNDQLYFRDFNYDCVKEFKMEIYNRWGHLMFVSEEIANHWDGRTNAGQRCPDGSYHYIIKVRNLKNELKTFTGTFSLLR